MLTYKDYPIGRVIELLPTMVTEKEIIEFASEFDPQPFHLDSDSEDARKVGGLIASGWHTCAILMRMMCDTYLLDTASQGSPGLDEVRWLKPVRPNDTLSGSVEVIGARISKSKSSLGLVNFSYTVKNQHDEVVMTAKGIGLVNTEVAA